MNINGYIMLKMLMMLWHLLQMEVNLLYGVLELVQRTKPRDKKRAHAGSGPSSEESTKKETEEPEERMTELVVSLRERHGAKYSTLKYRLWVEMYKRNSQDIGYTPTISTVWRRKVTTCKLSFLVA